MTVSSNPNKLTEDDDKAFLISWDYSAESYVLQMIDSKNNNKVTNLGYATHVAAENDKLYCVDSRVDYGRSRNLMLTSIVFVTGLSGISVNIGTVSLTGMVLACVVAMALSLIFYILDKLKLTNDREV